MNTPANECIDQRKSALIAGTALMIMMLAAAFSYGFVHASLLVAGDAEATMQNIISNNSLFKAVFEQNILHTGAYTPLSRSTQIARSLWRY